MDQSIKNRSSQTFLSLTDKYGNKFAIKNVALSKSQPLLNRSSLAVASSSSHQLSPEVFANRDTEYQASQDSEETIDVYDVLDMQPQSPGDAFGKIHSFISYCFEVIP